MYDFGQQLDSGRNIMICSDRFLISLTVLYLQRVEFSIIAYRL